ncbi:hypothetical protein M4578_08865 [Salipiger sp. P9]|uniref:cupredoxin domain-containing protein n=1 Tax=Salipiger pentaromativorans TaxID=2943193 RepID=UPI002157ACFC|nr:hypothetical protein [Salipiger pentaromativorans]MCR8547937.1 hypothetical protein [Salipiger pentaromativorans]
MLRKTGLLALTLGCLAMPLQAKEHYVLLLGDGYFPDYVYPNYGDTIRFVNNSNVAMSATATDASWTTGRMEPGAVVILEVVEGMKQTFVDTVATDSTAVGVIDYLNAAPLDLERNSEHNH